MKFQFLYSSLLWLLPILGAAWLYLAVRPGAALPGSRAPRNRAMRLQGLAALCLILAAAGLQYRHSARKIQLVVLADVSPSIFELSAQTARIREMLGALDPQSTEAAVVVFSETAGLERAMGPLPKGSALDSQRVPDLEHLSAVVKTDGTNIGNALQFARTAFTSTDCSRGILLLSDFIDTGITSQEPGKSAAFLAGGDIDFLPTPAVLVASSDVQLAELRAPESAGAGARRPLEITIASQQPAAVECQSAS